MRRSRRNHTLLWKQSLCVSELTEVVIPKGLKDEEKCDKNLHTAYRSLLGSYYNQEPSFKHVTSFHGVLLLLLRPTIGDCKTLNKLCRQ